MDIVNIIGLTKKYNDVTAINNINLTVKEGDFFGFIGANGAGKTTTIKTMLGLLKPSLGSIELFGNNINNNNFQEYIGLVPGEANLYDNLKVSQQIEYFMRFYKNVDLKYINDLKKLFDINDNKKISELSLGNKKKVSIVCALMSKPKLLVLDEVSNSLDPLMQKRLFDELLRLNKLGTTIFFSSHNLEEVKEYCNTLAIIRQGKIVKLGNVENIIRSVGLQVTLKTKEKFDTSFVGKYKNLSSGAITFVYKGEINKLINDLSKYNLISLRISDVKLEEIFEEYYEEQT